MERRRTHLVPISGLFSAVLIVPLILAGTIVSFGGVFSAADRVRLAVSVWAIRIAWEVCALPLRLPLIAFLKRAEGEDAYDADTEFNPFRLRE